MQGTGLCPHILGRSSRWLIFGVPQEVDASRLMEMFPRTSSQLEFFPEQKFPRKRVKSAPQSIKL